MQGHSTLPHAPQEANEFDDFFLHFPSFTPSPLLKKSYCEIEPQSPQALLLCAFRPVRWLGSTCYGSGKKLSAA